MAYLIPSTVSWTQLFNVMEDLKTDGSGSGRGLVEDYAATDPSLEQVFLTFAREADMAIAAASSIDSGVKTGYDNPFEVTAL